METTNLSPNERAWLEHQKSADPIPYKWDETHRNAFNAGVRHGINFVIGQIGWMLEERADSASADHSK